MPKRKELKIDQKRARMEVFNQLPYGEDFERIRDHVYRAYCSQNTVSPIYFKNQSRYSTSESCHSDEQNDVAIQKAFENDILLPRLLLLVAMYSSSLNSLSDLTDLIYKYSTLSANPFIFSLKSLLFEYNNPNDKNLMKQVRNLRRYTNNLLFDFNIDAFLNEKRKTHMDIYHLLGLPKVEDMDKVLGENEVAIINDFSLNKHILFDQYGIQYFSDIKTSDQFLLEEKNINVTQLNEAFERAESIYIEPSSDPDFSLKVFEKGSYPEYLLGRMILLLVIMDPLKIYKDEISNAISLDTIKDFFLRLPSQKHKPQNKSVLKVLSSYDLPNHALGYTDIETIVFSSCSDCEKEFIKKIFKEIFKENKK